MFVVEYDSDYIHSGDEDTIEGNEVQKKKIQKKKGTIQKQKYAVKKLLGKPNAEYPIVSNLKEPRQDFLKNADVTNYD